MKLKGPDKRVLAKAVLLHGVAGVPTPGLQDSVSVIDQGHTAGKALDR